MSSNGRLHALFLHSVFSITHKVVFETKKKKSRLSDEKEEKKIHQDIVKQETYLQNDFGIKKQAIFH